MSSSKNRFFIFNIVKMICKDYELTAEIIESTHYKIIFRNKFNEKCLCVLSKTSSNKKNRQVEIGLIRRELQRKFNLSVSNNYFTLQYKKLMF
jgi:hypothetical protein